MIKAFNMADSPGMQLHSASSSLTGKQHAHTYILDLFQQNRVHENATYKHGNVIHT